VTIPEAITVRNLAVALGLKPFEVIGFLLEFNVFASVGMLVRFHLASALCAHLGVIAYRTE